MLVVIGGSRNRGLGGWGLTAKSVLVASGCAKKRGDRFAQCSVFNLLRQLLGQMAKFGREPRQEG